MEILWYRPRCAPRPTPETRCTADC
jgi:hypothetical protein